jgi:hypothetical protein
MRKFTERPFGEVVDLDDPKIYDYLPNTCAELRDRMFKNIGYALVYMDYFPSRKGLFPKRKKKVKMYALKKGGKKFDINNGSYYQRLRVYELIKNFADNERENYKNIMWYKEQVFIFEDETENMC